MSKIINNSLILSKQEAIDLAKALSNPDIEVVQKRNKFLDSLNDIKIEPVNDTTVLVDVLNLSIPIILQSQVLYSTEEVKEKKESLQTIIDFSLNINYICDYKEAECISTDSNKGYYCKTINDELYTISTDNNLVA